jgi:hypothetical protein
MVGHPHAVSGQTWKIMLLVFGLLKYTNSLWQIAIDEDLCTKPARGGWWLIQKWAMLLSFPVSSTGMKNLKLLSNS